MRNRTRLLSATSLMLLWTAWAVWAAVPPVIHYQGVLTDSSGGVVTTTVDVLFSIFDAEEPGAAGGGPLWTEARTVTPDASGRFDVLLGEIDPLTASVFADPNRWLAVQISGDAEMAPRSRMASTPYGYRVATVDGATGGDIYGDVTLHSTFSVGHFLGDTGRIEIFNGSIPTITADGAGGSSGGGSLKLRGTGGNTTLNLEGDAGGTGFIAVNDAFGSAAVSLDGSAGHVLIEDPNGPGFIALSSNVFGTKGAEMSMYDFNGVRTVELGAEGGPGGAVLLLRDGTSLSAQVKAKSSGGGGELGLFNSSGTPTILLSAATTSNNFGKLQVTSGLPGGIVELNGNGTMSVGTPLVPAGYKMAVAGKMICEEVEVQLQASWPDYVFDDSYPLMPLNEVDNSIREHGHLPGMPSAEEVQASGVAVGDMQAKLLLKIEELTLHMIAMRREVNQLAEENQQLRIRMAQPNGN